jgi:hypothetical protein
MMRLLLASLVLAFTLVTSGPALAAGFGLYAEYVYANGGYDYDFSLTRRMFTESNFGIGFIYDNTVAADRLTNYRLDVGYQASKRTFDGIPGRYNGNSFKIENTLGFGFIRNQHMRVWAGPAVQLMFTRLDLPGDNDTEFHFGGGVRAGVNLHAGKVVTLSFSAGYRYLGIWGFEGQRRVGSDYAGGNHVVTANVALLFRSRGDRFGLTSQKTK